MFLFIIQFMLSSFRFQLLEFLIPFRSFIQVKENMTADLNIKHKQ